MSSTSGQIVCWGGGEHGQNGHAVKYIRSGATSLIESVEPNDSFMISCGASHTVCASTDKLVVWGNGTRGQLGTGNLDNQSQPQAYFVPIDADDSITGISCGAQHSILWTKNGVCYGFGANSHHQLALSEMNNTEFVETQSIAVLLREIQHNEVIHVSCGGRHTLFLYSDGTVAAVGANTHGQLGTGSRHDSSEVTVIPGLEHVVIISCGANHSLALTECGDLYVWGYGKALGYRHKDIVIPTKKVSHYTNLIQITGGATHCLGLTENGNVYSWGAGVDGQLGHGPEKDFIVQPTKLDSAHLPESICQVSAGDFYSAAVSANGNVYVWGKHPDLVLKPASDKENFSPLKIELGNITIKSISCGLWHMTCVTGTPKPGASRREMISRLSVREIAELNTDKDDEVGLKSLERDRTTLADFYSEDTMTNERSVGLTILGAPHYPDIVESPREDLISPHEHLNSPHEDLADDKSEFKSEKSLKLPEIVITKKTTPKTALSHHSSQLTSVKLDKLSAPVYIEQINNHSTNHRLNQTHRPTSLIEHHNSDPSLQPRVRSPPRRTSITSNSELVVPEALNGTNTGAWNPHRGSLFAELFNQKLAEDINAYSSLPSLTQKNMGFLPLSDIRILDQKRGANHVVKQQTKRTRDFKSKHSENFIKEIELRNKQRDMRNTYKTASPRSMQQQPGVNDSQQPAGIARQGTVFFDHPPTRREKMRPKVSRRTQMNPIKQNPHSAPNKLSKLARQSTILHPPKEKPQVLGLTRYGTLINTARDNETFDHRLTPDFAQPLTNTKFTSLN